MDKSMLIGTIAGVALATAGGVWAGYEILDKDDTVASAVGEDCYNEVVERQAEPADKDRIAGTVIGAVVGGVIGSEIGDGDGKKAATVAGAAGGAYAGNRAQKKFQEGRTEVGVERRCKDSG